MNDLGEKPEGNYTLDRIDVNGDYTPQNCRWADSQTQQRNKRVCRKSRTGITGVIPYKDKFQANIRVDGKLHHLGYFNTISEAASVRKRAEEKFWGRKEVMPL